MICATLWFRLANIFKPCSYNSAETHPCNNSQATHSTMLYMGEIIMNFIYGFNDV